MYNMEDILARLQNGEDPEVIANEFTDALNSALDQKRKVDAELQVKDEANTYLAAASQALYEYIKLVHPEADEDMVAELAEEDNLADFINVAINAMKAFAPLADLLSEHKCDCKEEKPSIKINPNKSATLQGTWNTDDNDIATFLKKFGL